MNLITFLKDQEPDFNVRFLSDIWNFRDIDIERNHDFVQILFPLEIRSNNTSHHYYIDSPELLSALINDDLVKENIIKSSKWFLKFLSRNEHWKKSQDHNHLRITRIIKCIRLIVSDEEADNFYDDVLELLGNDNLINKRTLEFWSEAWVYNGCFNRRSQ